MSPKLQGFCNIKHQSCFLAWLRRPQSSAAALSSHRHAGHTPDACLVLATMLFAGCPNETCPATSEADNHKSNQEIWVFMAKNLIHIHHYPLKHQVCDLK